MITFWAIVFLLLAINSFMFMNKASKAKKQLAKILYTIGGIAFLSFSTMLFALNTMGGNYAGNNGASVQTSETPQETQQPAQPIISQPVEAPSKTFLTKDEFNKLFKLDPEEKQYENGKFKLKDGSIVHADYLNYGKSNIFEYAMAIFYKGNLARVKVETKGTEEGLIKGLGLTPSKQITINPTPIGYEIVLDDTFDMSNIAFFPNEWD